MSCRLDRKYARTCSYTHRKVGSSGNLTTEYLVVLVDGFGDALRIAVTDHSFTVLDLDPGHEEVIIKDIKNGTKVPYEDFAKGFWTLFNVIREKQE